jgi:geranylgeranyl pyrophosphate synthase
MQTDEQKNERSGEIYDAKAAFLATLERYREMVETALDRAISNDGRLNEIMRYAVLSGGKRLRGILVLTFRDAANGDPQSALTLAVAAELLHAYSLVHDDLPCMDDDDFRRGKPSVHKQFGEWQAVLAGDALHAKAFAFAASAKSISDDDGEPSNGAAILASASEAICRGQFMDLSAETQNSKSSDEIQLPSAAMLENTDGDNDEDCDANSVANVALWKTAMLFVDACRLGWDCDAAIGFGLNFGMMFQIRDDLQDGDGFVAEHGEAQSRFMLEQYAGWAKEKAPNDFLKMLVDYVGGVE